VGAAIRVFISYAHESDAHKQDVRRLSDLLRANGVDARFDQAAADRPQMWATWVIQQFREADHVLVVVSPGFPVRAEQRGSPGVGRGVSQEWRLIVDESFADQERALERFLVVLLPGASRADIPTGLYRNSRTVYRVDDFTVAGAQDLLRVLTGQPRYVERGIGPVPIIPPNELPAPVVVMRLVATGGSDQQRAEVLDIVGAHTTAATVEERGPDTSAAVLVMPVETADDAVETIVDAVARFVRRTGEAGPVVRVGLDLDRVGSDPVHGLAQRLSDCDAIGTVRRSATDVVVAASATFHAHLRATDRGVPKANAFAERPQDGLAGATCWLAVVGRSTCPPARSGRPKPDHSRSRYEFSNNSGSVAIVDSSPGGYAVGSVHIVDERKER
jgi:hypothetical protein